MNAKFEASNNSGNNPEDFGAVARGRIIMVPPRHSQQAMHVRAILPYGVHGPAMVSQGGICCKT